MKWIAAVAMALLGASAQAADEVTGESDAAGVETGAEQDAQTDNAGPKMMSGMSILGNEEAPKALVIIPWKSSELGDDITLTDTLDDRARPVDKEVFLRELSFYEIRAAE